MQNPVPVKNAIAIIEDVVDQLGIDDFFRMPINVLNHQLTQKERKITLHIPLKVNMPLEVVAELHTKLTAAFQAYGVAVEDVRPFNPQGNYLGYVNVRLTEKAPLAAVRKNSLAKANLYNTQVPHMGTMRDLLQQSA